jgi:hypothetical protein
MASPGILKGAFRKLSCGSKEKEVLKEVLKTPRKRFRRIREQCV